MTTWTPTRGSERQQARMRTGASTRVSSRGKTLMTGPRSIYRPHGTSPTCRGSFNSGPTHIATTLLSHSNAARDVIWPNESVGICLTR